MSHEENEKREEYERLRINRKIKPEIKRKLLKILERVRKRLEQEEVKTATVDQKRMSLKVALRPDLFDHKESYRYSDSSDDEQDEGFKSKKKLNNKTISNASEKEKQNLGQKHAKSANKSAMNLDLGLNGVKNANMGEEASYTSSSDSNSSQEDESKSYERSKTSSVSSNSSQKESSNFHISKSRNDNNKSKTAYLTNLKKVNRKGWRNPLNISRNTIIEVDEEQKSDTTNKKSSCISLAFGNMMTSSFNKSARRFYKVSSTLKGNSPDTSLIAPNKDFSDISNPYYEQTGLSHGKTTNKRRK